MSASKLFVVTSLLIPIFLIPIYADEFPLDITNNPSDSIKPQIFLDDTFVYLVYMDHPDGKADIFFTKSQNGGLNFDPPLNLSSNNGTSAWPRLEVFESNVYVTWYDYSHGTSDIFFSASEDNGNTFKTSTLWENKGVSFNPWIKVFEDNIFIVWNDDTPNFVEINKTSNIDEIDISLGNTDIIVAVSNDKGKSFKIHNLSNTFSTSDTPRIAINGENVYVVWNQLTQNGFEIAFSMSKDSGLTFSEKFNISNSSNRSINAGIKAYDNLVYVIWMEDVGGADDIFFSKSEDNGLSFSEPVNLSNSNLSSFIVRDGNMAVWQDYIYIVWTESSNDTSDVFFVKSNDAGKTFSNPVNLSESEAAGFTQIVADKKNVYVLWSGLEEDEPQSLFIRASSDGGDTFRSISKINSPTGKSQISILGPQIALSDHTGYVIYEGDVNENWDLFLERFDRTQPSDGVITLQTEKEDIEIRIKIEPDPYVDKETTFELNFIDPKTGNMIDNVNYSLYFEDSQGNIVFETNGFTENGFDSKTMTFQEMGPITLKINVLETGSENIETKSGFSSAVITVVPEFPIGVMIVIIIGLALCLILNKSNVTSINKMRYY